MGKPGKFIPGTHSSNQKMSLSAFGEKNVFILFEQAVNVKVHLPNESCYDIEELVSDPFGEDWESSIIT